MAWISSANLHHSNCASDLCQLWPCLILITARPYIYSNISGDLKEKLQRAQNKSIRYIRNWFSQGWSRHTCQTAIRSATDMWLMYFSAIIIYKAHRIGQPKYLAEHFNTRRRIDVGRGDAIPGLDLPSWSSETGRKSLKYECSKFWNEQPNRIRDIHSLGGFKSALFKLLFNSDSQ